MDKGFKNFLNSFKQLNLPENGYAIFGSGPMAARNIRPAHDLDVVVKNEIYQELLKKYPENEKGFIEIGKIEICCVAKSIIDNPEEVIERAEKIDGIKFVSLNDIVAWKEKMGRPKDFIDIKLIKNYLEKHKI